MASKTRIKEMAKELNLHTLASMKFGNPKMAALDYLEYILSQELDARKTKQVARLRAGANLPNLELGMERLHPAVRRQVEMLLTCGWIEQVKNLVIVGECGTGKTALATKLGCSAVERGHKVVYLKADELLELIRQKDIFPKARATLNRAHAADLVILDEMFYLEIVKEDLATLYKTIMQLNDTTSLVFITNREISDWIATSDDKYTMQLLIKRAVENGEMIRLVE